MPLNPFANLGIRTPSIATPKLPAILTPYQTTYKQGPYTGPAAPAAPVQPLGDWKTPMGLTENWGKTGVPVTSWFTNPSPYVKSLESVSSTIKATPPIIPLNAAGQPDSSLLPKGYSTNWGTTTPSWATPSQSMPPAPTMQKLTTPAPVAKSAVKAAPAKAPVKTTVSAPKTK